MQIAEITQQAGADKKRKRVGRGRGSGHGKTCGRGHKGSGQRSGGAIRPLTEGGQMPLFRRIPKRGFSNCRFRSAYHVVNVGDLDDVFESGAEVTKLAMVQAGLIRNDRVSVKVLGDGNITKRMSVQADKFSKSAVQKITAAGGSAKEHVVKV